MLAESDDLVFQPIPRSIIENRKRRRKRSSEINLGSHVIFSRRKETKCPVKNGNSQEIWEGE